MQNLFFNIEHGTCSFIGSVMKNIVLIIVESCDLRILFSSHHESTASPLG